MKWINIHVLWYHLARLADAPGESRRFLLVGTGVLVPMFLAYMAYAYWVFRGAVVSSVGYR